MKIISELGHLSEILKLYRGQVALVWESSGPEDCAPIASCYLSATKIWLAIWNLHLAILHYLQRYHKERTKKMRMIFSINYKSRFLRRSTRLINLTVQRVSTARKGIAGMHIFWCHKYKHYILREFVKLSIRHEQTDFGQYNEI